MQKNVSLVRINKEFREMKADPSPFFYAEPLHDEPFEWHFTIRGPEGTEFEQGFYHGIINLPL